MIPRDYFEFSKAAIMADVNILCVGQPGAGKTDVNKKVFESLGWPFEVMHPVVDEPTDYKGFPFIFETNEYLPVDAEDIYIPHSRQADFVPFGPLQRLIDAKGPIGVIIDDLGQATAMVQAAVMQLVWGGNICGHKISEHVRFVMISNRREDKAGVSAMLSPLKNRAVIVQMDTDVQDWCEWAIKNNMPPELIAFNRFRPQHLLNGFVASSNMKNCPTPRSIAMLGKLAKSGIRDDMKAEVYTGAVGEAMAVEYISFEKLMNLPDLFQWIKDPSTFTLPRNENVKYAASAGLASIVKPELMDNFIALTRQFPEEYQMSMVRDAITYNQDNAETGAFIQWAGDNHDVLAKSLWI